MRGEIIRLEKVWDDSSCIWFWQAILEFENMPRLKLGNCEVEQHEEKYKE